MAVKPRAFKLGMQAKLIMGGGPHIPMKEWAEHAGNDFFSIASSMNPCKSACRV